MPSAIIVINFAPERELADYVTTATSHLPEANVTSIGTTNNNYYNGFNARFVVRRRLSSLSSCYKMTRSNTLRARTVLWTAWSEEFKAITMPKLILIPTGYERHGHSCRLMRSCFMTVDDWGGLCLKSFVTNSALSVATLLQATAGSHNVGTNYHNSFVYRIAALFHFHFNFLQICNFVWCNILHIKSRCYGPGIFWLGYNYWPQKLLLYIGSRPKKWLWWNKA